MVSDFWGVFAGLEAWDIESSHDSGAFNSDALVRSLLLDAAGSSSPVDTDSLECALESATVLVIVTSLLSALEEGVLVLIVVVEWRFLDALHK